MTIEFLFKPEAPIAIPDVKTVLKGTDYGTEYNAEENAIVEAEWAKVLEANPKSFSRPNSRATLTDSREENGQFTATFRPTEFKTYVATAHHVDEPMRRSIYEGMRIAAIGGIILTSDGYTLIHRRPNDLTHAGGKLDSSFAGFVDIKNLNPEADPKAEFKGELLIDASVRKKLSAELRLEGADISDIMLTGFHSGRYPDYSGMFDVVARTRLSANQLDQQANKKLIGECFFMHPSEVPAFLLDHYGPGKDMLADGCAVMLTSIPDKLFLPTIRDLNDAGATIQFGHVKNARFYAK